MRIPRLFVGSGLTAGEQVTLDARAHRHAVHVLRLRAGSPVVLFNGGGGEFTGELVQVERHRSQVLLHEHRPTRADPPLDIELVQCIAKGERMDYSVQKATELGVTAIQPVFSAHGIVPLPAARLENRVRHWEGVVISACEQCGRSHLPALRTPIALEAWLERTGAGRAGFVLDPTAPSGLGAPTTKLPGTPLYVLVGPEGGLSTGEIVAAERAGLTRLRLGPRVLRTETAAAAILVAIQLHWGDMRS